MAFDWAHYLALAEELAGRNGDEAALRSAISRAYYAVLCTARNRLRQQNIDLDTERTNHQQEHGGKDPGSHGIVWILYHRDRRSRSVEKNGNRLRRMRKRADYCDEYPGLSNEVILAGTRARKALGSLRALPVGVPRIVA